MLALGRLFRFTLLAALQLRFKLAHLRHEFREHVHRYRGAPCFFVALPFFRLPLRGRLRNQTAHPAVVVAPSASAEATEIVQRLWLTSRPSLATSQLWHSRS